MQLYLATSLGHLAGHYRIEQKQLYDKWLLCYRDMQGAKTVPDDILEILRRSKVMIDSGAFVFQKGHMDTDYDTYVKKYVEWLKRHRDLWTCYVEMDIPNKVGTERVQEWREYMIDELGEEPIMVWHREWGIKGWKEMLEKYKYVGITGKGNDFRKKLDPMLFIKDARAHGVKIHGFGFTRPDLLKTYPFYSVDSTSWAANARFGHGHKFVGGKLVPIKDIKFKRKMATEIQIYGTKEWAKFGWYLEKYWEGYWNESDGILQDRDKLRT